jgi:hypothetical protein
MSTCQHLSKQGDNYGITCTDCGEALEGYGYGGWFGSNLKGNEQCLHGENAWYKISVEQEKCLYCHIAREREKKAN